MSFFKSTKKNKTASAANTPAQTPRTSIQLNASEIADIHKATSSQQLLNPEAALDLLFQKGAMGHMQALSIARI